MFCYILLNLIFLCVIIIGLTYYLTKKPKNFPPGPSWYPIVGSYPQLKKLGKTYGDTAIAFEKLSKHYNSNVIGLKLGLYNFVVISSYELIKSILLDPNFSGRPNTFFYKLRCMGKIRGLSFTNGKHWVTQRSFVVKHLHNLEFGKKVMETKIKSELQAILNLIDANPVCVNFKSLLSPSVLNILWTLAAGTTISRDDFCITRLLKVLHKRMKAFDTSGGTLNYFPWLRFIAPERTGYNLIKSVNSELKGIITQIIQEHRDSWTENRNDDLIFAYISEIKKSSNADKTFSYEQLLVICLDLFLGGATNTSTTLDFLFLSMVLHPDVQIKIQKLLDKTFNPEEPLEYSDKEKVPYVEALIMEVMRCYAILPIIGVRTPTADAIVDGYSINKETVVLLNLHTVFTNAKHFPEPEAFRPERFLDKEGKLVPNPAHIPFGLGKRKCLADSLARNCIFIFFAEIVRRYKIQASHGVILKRDVMVPGLSRSPQDYSVDLVKRF